VVVLALALSAAATPGHTALARPGAPAVGAEPRQAAHIVSLVRDAMAQYDLKAVIVRVTVDGREVVTAALGESMTGVPATTDMHFHNGAVVFSYMTTLLLVFVDQGLVRLDDPLSHWLPELPDAERVTLRMLANMTAGYQDYVANQQLIEAFYADPFRPWTPQELIAIGLSAPRVFEPGSNWAYSHTDYVILGEALERIGGKPLATLLQEYVLAPLGLNNTASWPTAVVPEPVLHTFSSERREQLGIPRGTRFYEEATFWNPSWTTARGAIQTTNIYDMATTAVAVGEGTLLSRESHQAQVGPGLLGLGAPLAGCFNCATLNRDYNYGLGVVLSRSWILQNPLFAGCGAIEAYLPSRRIAIAVATTFGEQSFDEQGNYTHGNASQNVFAAIGAYLAPEDAPPQPSGRVD
jgi:CubicO group peptidase (beta-lactamase class C family)